MVEIEGPSSVRVHSSSLIAQKGREQSLEARTRMAGEAFEQLQYFSRVNGNKNANEDQN